MFKLSTGLFESKNPPPPHSGKCGSTVCETWLSCLMMFCTASVLFFRLRARCSMSSASFSCTLWWCCSMASSSAASSHSSPGTLRLGDNDTRQGGSYFHSFGFNKLQFSFHSVLTLGSFTSIMNCLDLIHSGILVDLDLD